MSRSALRLQGGVTVTSPSMRRDPRAARSRAILIGTAATVQQLNWALSAYADSPVVLGCVLASGGMVAEPATPMLGDVAELPRVIDTQRPTHALVCLPAAMSQLKQAVTDTLDRAGVAWRWMPPLADQLAGRLGQSISPIPTLDLAKLIDREPRPLDAEAIRRTIAGRFVMISGAGGSIGSEMARIVAHFAPGRLVLVERAENALFEIDREIARTHPDLPRAAVLHDVTNAPRTVAMMQQHRPDVVFHAAAHKHVPMMEDHPADAVENNFYGTRSIADAFVASGGASGGTSGSTSGGAGGTKRFVMISTDKAVNPSSVMGASKRLAELYIQHLNAKSTTRFCMVRFGNVLGSACSVLPIWSQQIARGEPVTVTHPDMQRYFMTIPEAAGLVLQSAAFCEGGEVFLLDMGEPVRVLDLASRYIRSQGLEPDVDVPIRITGIRPGEKLFEELAYDGSEDMLPTPHESIRIWRTTPPSPASMTQIIETFDRLRHRSNAHGGAAPAHPRNHPGNHPWQHATREAIVMALRASIPEMVAAAAG